MISLRAALSRITAPLIARKPRRVAALLRSFAVTELGSAYTMRWAARGATDDRARAQYLRHALDEERHARLFSARAHKLAGEDATPLRSEAEDLFATLGERRFLAFVAKAERRGRAQFEAHRRALSERDPVTAALFSRIIEEEKEHERYARELLHERFPRTVMVTLAEVLLWEQARASRRAMNALTGAVFRLVMTLVYVCLWPMTIALKLDKRAQRGAPSGSARPFGE